MKIELTNTYKDWDIATLMNAYENVWTSVHTPYDCESNASPRLREMEAELNRRGYDVRVVHTPKIVLRRDQ